MEKVGGLVKDSRRYFDIADHMLYTTYPLVGDTKILITVAENLYKCLINGMDAVIRHNYLYKRIGRNPVDFEGKIEMFK